VVLLSVGSQFNLNTSIMESSLTLLLFVLSVSRVFSSRFVIEPEKYLMKIHEKSAVQLSEADVLNIEMFTADINKTDMGKTFEGKVTFDYGFVRKIGKFELNKQKYAEVWNETLVSLSLRS
jgi:hypothetical protein